MESYFNVTNCGTSDDIYYDIPLFATYFSIMILLVAIPAIIIPAVLVIRIILQTEKLHTIYYLFVINLLATDILNTLRMGLEITLMCLYLFCINVDTTVSLNFIIYTILSIPRIAARFSFITLAIDRVVAIAFPYRHKSIMTYKRAYIMMMLTWTISSIVNLVTYSASSFAFIGSFGIFIPLDKPIVRALFFVILLGLSFILIICVNVYLYVQINKSKQKLEENMRINGGNNNNATQKNILQI